MNRAPLDLPADDLRVVLDTNVVLSLWHFAHPQMLALREWLAERRATLLTRADCLAELDRVLALPRFRIAPERRAEIAADYRARTTVVEARSDAALPRCTDPEDQRFLEVAWEGGAHLLLTRDKPLLSMATRAPWVGRTQIVPPERLLGSIGDATPRRRP